MDDPTAETTVERRIESLLDELALITDGLQPLIQAQQAALAIAQAPLNNIRNEIKRLVLEKGESVSTPVARATYRRESIRTSWDNKALNGYAAAHPEIEQFRKESSVKASVSIKLV